MQENTTGNTINTRDRPRSCFKDWGAGQPVVFSHGWPLKIYKGAPHGLGATLKNEVGGNLLDSRKS